MYVYIYTYIYLSMNIYIYIYFMIQIFEIITDLVVGLLKCSKLYFVSHIYICYIYLYQYTDDAHLAHLISYI